MKYVISNDNDYFKDGALEVKNYNNATKAAYAISHMKNKEHWSITLVDEKEESKYLLMYADNDTIYIPRYTVNVLPKVIADHLRKWIPRPGSQTFEIEEE